MGKSIEHPGIIINQGTYLNTLLTSLENISHIVCEIPLNDRKNMLMFLLHHLKQERGNKRVLFTGVKRRTYLKKLYNQYCDLYPQDACKYLTKRRVHKALTLDIIEQNHDESLKTQIYFADIEWLYNRLGLFAEDYFDVIVVDALMGVVKAPDYDWIYRWFEPKKSMLMYDKLKCAYPILLGFSEYQIISYADIYCKLTARKMTLCPE